MKLYPKKSRRISFAKFEVQKRKANTYDFLRFTHFCDKTRKGWFKLSRKTSKKKFAAKSKDMNQWLKSIRNKIKTKDWWEISASKLRGHYQYYGISGNYRLINNFYKQSIKAIHKWMNRRSQKKKMNWDRFNKYLEHYALPKPSIKRNFYTGYSYAVR